jgi:LPS-assembly protein
VYKKISKEYTKLLRKSLAALLLLVNAALAQGQVADEVWPLVNGGVTTLRQHNVEGSANAETDVTVIEADRISGIRGSFVDAEGDAFVFQNDDTIRAQFLRYDISGDNVTGRDEVELTSPGILVQGETISYQPGIQAGEITSASYFLNDSGHGQADKLILVGPNRQRGLNATYTSCDVDKEDVYIKSTRLEIYQDEDYGSARNATVWFKGAPILYSPYISFPLSDARKTGFLTPSYGQTVQNGFEVRVPFYLNLAPNFDGTVTMRSMSERGNLIKTGWRYLGNSFHGDFDYDTIRSDSIYEKQFGVNESRSSYMFHHFQKMGPYLAGRLNFRGVSDDAYLKDLSTNPGETALVHLPRSVSLLSAGEDWTVDALVRHYQSLNFQPQPFQLDPQINVTTVPMLGLGFELDSRAQYSDFDHLNARGIRDGGTRTILYPGIRHVYENDFLNISPKIGLHYTTYDLDNGRTEDRTVPIYSFKGSIAFEREINLGGEELTQTLEPLISYVHVPFRDQTNLPVFDTGLADFSISQIFSENIFSGGDRINDADQFTFGVSSSLLDYDTSAERFKITLAQRFNLDEEFVVITESESPRTANRSDILLEANGGITRTVGVTSIMQYSGILNEVIKQEQGVTYAPQTGKRINVLYRYSRDNHEQYDISGQWPVIGRWGLAGRWNYSNDARKLLEGVLGVEYKVGCWAFRIVANRFLNGLDDKGKDRYATGLFVQLELRGITRIGSNAIGELERSVQGFSPN